jgi:hypothetical protein
MYDLVKNPPKKKADLRVWLTSWIEKIDHTIFYDIHGELFIIIAGFSRSGYTHEILQSKTTKEYAWWIRDSAFEASGPKDPYARFPNERYSSLEMVLTAIIDYYSRKWNLTE